MIGGEMKIDGQKLFELLRDEHGSAEAGRIIGKIEALSKESSIKPGPKPDVVTEEYVRLSGREYGQTYTAIVTKTLRDLHSISPNVRFVFCGETRELKSVGMIKKVSAHYPPGTIVVTPSGRQAVVLRYMNGTGKADTFERAICRYLDSTSEKECVTLHPRFLRKAAK